MKVKAKQRQNTFKILNNFTVEKTLKDSAVN